MEASGIPSWFQRNRPSAIDPNDEHFLEDAFAQPWMTHGGCAIELGCGTGPLTRWLADKGFKTMGVDVSETALRIAKRQSEAYQVDYQVADVCQKSIRAIGKFDFCVDGRCLHGITNMKDRTAVLSNIRQLLKPNGVFMLMSMCLPIDRRSLSREYPDQRIVRNVIYCPAKRGGAFSGFRTIGGKEYIPTRILQDSKSLLASVQKIGLQPMLVRFNRYFSPEPVSSLNLAAINFSKH